MGKAGTRIATGRFLGTEGVGGSTGSHLTQKGFGRKQPAGWRKFPWGSFKKRGQGKKYLISSLRVAEKRIERGAPKKALRECEKRSEEAEKDKWRQMVLGEGQKRGRRKKFFC